MVGAPAAVEVAPVPEVPAPAAAVEVAPVPEVPAPAPVDVVPVPAVLAPAGGEAVEEAPEPAVPPPAPMEGAPAQSPATRDTRSGQAGVPRPVPSSTSRLHLDTESSARKKRERSDRPIATLTQGSTAPPSKKPKGVTPGPGGR